MAGLKFRNQHPLDHYIVDFFCNEQMLAIEVDGGIHLQAEQKELDQARALYLQERGIRVWRFSNSEVCENLDTVLNSITEFVEKNPIKNR